MSFRAYLVGAILCLAALGWLAWKRDPVALVVMAPLFAYFAARSFLTWGADSGPQAMRSLMGLGKWSGLYYEFGRIHLRAAEHEEALVFLEADILQVLGQKKSLDLKFFTPEERVPFAGKRGAMALTRAGCHRLLMKSSHPEAKNLLRYLEGQAFQPWAKRQERISGEED